MEDGILCLERRKNMPFSLMATFRVAWKQEENISHIPDESIYISQLIPPWRYWFI